MLGWRRCGGRCWGLWVLLGSVACASPPPFEAGDVALEMSETEDSVPDDVSDGADGELDGDVDAEVDGVELDVPCPGPCGANAHCVAGECLCEADFGDCDPDVLGCETDLQSAQGHCGVCDRPCTGADFCVDGKCQEDCNPPMEPCGAVCVSVASDPEHCGACFVTCGVHATCALGQCQCREGYGDCDDEPGCEQPLNTPEHCGACGFSCLNAGGCTASGQCLCASGWTGPRCEDFACVIPCENGGSCAGPNRCECPEGWSDPQCTTPVCVPACTNGGVCSDAGRCACPLGWLGAHCEILADEVRLPASGDASTFTMGCPADDTWCSLYSTPAHQVTLSAYFLDRYPVTAKDYGLCVTAGACAPAGAGDQQTYGVVGLEDHPINYVDLDQATTYCAWVGKRLPTEAEWERAAKGTTHRRFPWGDDCPQSWDSGVCAAAEWTPTTAKANCSEASCKDGFDGTSPVWAFAAGVSPDGLWDMVGNVWEWTSDRSYRSYSAEPVTNPVHSAGVYWVVRGGSWYYSSTFIRAYYRNNSGASTRNLRLGIRCARSVSP